jgi:nitroreductase
MQTVAPETLLSQLQWRYATKKFDPAKKIPDATWATIERAFTLAPSSYGLQPWKFYVVTNPQVRAKLREVSWNQPQITDASHLVVFCQQTRLDEAAVDRYMQSIATTRGVGIDTLAGFKTMIMGGVAKPETLPGASTITYTRSQTYIALGFFLYTCAMLGVDACPMEGFDPKGYDSILNISSSGYMPVVLGAAGYRDPTDWVASQKKVRYATSDSITYVR